MELRLYEWIVYLYGASIVLYFADFMKQNRKVNRIAFWILTVVWGLQTFFFILRMVRVGHFPIVTQFEALFFYSWLLITFSLLLNFLFRIDFFLFFLNVAGFIVFVINLFANPSAAILPGEILTSRLMVIHISFALVSYVAFLASAVLSGMTLLLHRMLKGKKWNALLRRLPNLDRLGRSSFLLILFGVPIYLISIILGLIWAGLVLKTPFYLDVKVWLSFIVLGVYSFYLYAAMKKGWGAIPLATWNLIFFLLVVVNYISSRTISMFHQWF
ncbi:MAG: cytochrome c biogenesis protein CcsA [Thermicanus sp.]|nr:cytochrome c biogenesis protein CcsA [Thermicanus sp.]